MNSMDAVNFQSLNMVREELVATIEQSARHLENFVTAQDDGESLQACIDGIQQIVGILRLIQFRGACQLAEELLATANDIVPGGTGKQYERRLEVVSNVFFVMARYLEYVQQTERKVPVLLIPWINSLRKFRGEPAYPESHFFSFNISTVIPPEIEKLTVDSANFKPTLRRIRQMYQVGLLGYIRERNIKNSVALMRRALIRLHKIAGSVKPLSSLWWLGNVALEVFISEKMEVIESRKLLLGRIDRVIKQVQDVGETAFDAAPPKSLIKELVYLIMLSGAETDNTKRVKQACAIKSFPYTDKSLASERDGLNGPSAHTVSSLAKVLQSEISSTKKVLESATQTATQEIDDLAGFTQTLKNIAEILAVVGLNSASGTLKEEIKRVEKWGDNDGVTPTELTQVANTLLFIESTVSSLDKAGLADTQSFEITQEARNDAVASSELAIAQKIVVEECEAGISLTKRALNSFSDSYDTGHIRNIAKTLNTIRGGMIMLKKDRAANILKKCSIFVEEVLLDKEPPAAIKELLETFADVVISIEYYLDSATSTLQMDENVLKIAEEGLEALGHAVNE